MLTLDALMRNPDLELGLAVSGESGALDHEVLWVHTTELADPSRYVREGELVLTNGVWLPGAEATGFVAAIASKRAAGLVFGLTENRHQVPAEIIEACEAVGLPLMTLPIHVPFTAVTQAAAQLQGAARQELLVDAVRRGNALATVISRGGGVAGVLGVLGEEHALPLAVVDRRGQQLASINKDDDPGFLLAAAAGLAKSPPPLTVEWGDGRAARLFLVEGAMGDVAAGLFCLRPGHELDTEEHRVLEQAARFLSLEVTKQQAVQAIEMRFSGEILEMVLSGGSRSRELAERLRTFGLDPASPLGVYALAFADPGQRPPSLEQDLRDFFVARHIPVCIVPGSQDTVMIFAWPGTELELRRIASNLSSSLQRPDEGRRAVVGIGELSDDSTRLRESLVRAREACRVLVSREDGPTTSTFREIGTHLMLLGLQDSRVLRRFAEDELSAIRRHDQKSGSSLEVTLRTFLAHNGSWNATAEALFIHVNTLRNRLARVGELTGRDLSRFEDRVDLFLALQADAMS